MALPDPHELMSGALILRGKKVDINQLNKNPKVEGTKLTKDLVDNYAKNVIGWEQRDLDKFMVDDDMADLKNLGKAISVSNLSLIHI